MEFALAKKRNSDFWDPLDTDEIKSTSWLRRRGKEIKFHWRIHLAVNTDHNIKFWHTYMDGQG